MRSFKPTAQTFGQIFVIVSVEKTVLFIGWNIEVILILGLSFTLAKRTLLLNYISCWFVTNKLLEKQERTYRCLKKTESLEVVSVPAFFFSSSVRYYNYELLLMKFRKSEFVSFY